MALNVPGAKRKMRRPIADSGRTTPHATPSRASEWWSRRRSCSVEPSSCKSDPIAEQVAGSMLAWCRRVSSRSPSLGPFSPGPRLPGPLWRKPGSYRPASSKLRWCKPARHTPERRTRARRKPGHTRNSRSGYDSDSFHKLLHSKILKVHRARRALLSPHLRETTCRPRPRSGATSQVQAGYTRDARVLLSYFLRILFVFSSCFLRFLVPFSRRFGLPSAAEVPLRLRVVFLASSCYFCTC